MGPAHRDHITDGATRVEPIDGGALGRVFMMLGRRPAEQPGVEDAGFVPRGRVGLGLGLEVPDRLWRVGDLRCVVADVVEQLGGDRRGRGWQGGHRGRGRGVWLSSGGGRWLGGRVGGGDVWLLGVAAALLLAVAAAHGTPEVVAWRDSAVRAGDTEGHVVGVLLFGRQRACEGVEAWVVWSVLTSARLFMVRGRCSLGSTPAGLDRSSRSKVGLMVWTISGRRLAW